MNGVHSAPLYATDRSDAGSTVVGLCERVALAYVNALNVPLKRGLMKIDDRRWRH